MEEDKLKEKYIATLIGCAIGDTLGMPVESWSREQIGKYAGKITEPIYPILIKDEKGELIRKDEFGELKYWTRDLKKGEYTDDTILTLAIAESIAEKKAFDFQDICQKQIEAYNLCIQPDGHVKGAWGGTTKKAFEKIKSGVSPLESSVEPGLGDGPPMKMSPIGIYMHATGKYSEGLKVARLTGSSTHTDERAITAGIMQAYAIYTLLNNKILKEQFIDSLIYLCEKEEKPLNNNAALAERGNLTSRLKWIQDNADIEDEEAYKYLGNSSLVFEAYPFTIFMFQKYWDAPLEGLIEVVNWGGDCDTTGAMYGALAGAKNGMIFPEKWLEVLQNKERLKNAAEQIYEIRRKK